MSQYRVVQFVVNITPSISASAVFEAADDDVALIKAYNHVVTSRKGDAERDSNDPTLPNVYIDHAASVLASQFHSMIHIGLDHELVEDAASFMMCKLNVVKTFSVAMTLEELASNIKFPVVRYMLEKVA